jgi:hypothetical protein
MQRKERDESAAGFIPFFMPRGAPDSTLAELARFLQVPLKSP